MSPVSYPVLYSFRRCPYAMRARMALDYAGVRVQIREVALKAKPQQLLVISPKGTVPVLQLPTGVVIEQSLDIMRWACQLADPDNWLEPSMTEGGLQWLSTNDGPFKLYLDRYKYPDRYPEQTGVDYRNQAVQTMLSPMELLLAKTPFLMGGSCSLVDVALMPFIRQFAQVDAAWFSQAPYPRVKAWLEGFLRSERFDRIMRKFDTWTPDHGDVLF